MAVVYLLDHLSYNQNCSCEFWEVCSVLERYKDYKSEKLISSSESLDFIFSLLIN